MSMFPFDIGPTRKTKGSPHILPERGDKNQTSEKQTVLPILLAGLRPRESS